MEVNTELYTVELQVTTMDQHTSESPTVAELRFQPAEHELADVYSDIEIENLPEWWQRAILEYEEHELRPYQPPRFSDEILKYKVVNPLEEEHGVTIRFCKLHGSYGDDWTVEIDGEPIGEIGRHRNPNGYTVYEMSSDDFESWIRSHLE